MSHGTFYLEPGTRRWNVRKSFIKNLTLAAENNHRAYRRPKQETLKLSLHKYSGPENLYCEYLLLVIGELVL